MHPAHRLRAQQQTRVRQRTERSDAYTFFNLLTGPELLDKADSLLPEHRERLFPPTEALSMFLSQALSADRSCRRAVNEAAVKRLIGGLAPVSTHTGGYCRARARLPLSMLSGLTQHTGQAMAAKAPSAWHWRGHPVRLVDGTTVTMPDTEENQAVYPQPRSQAAGLGFPLARLVGMICLGSGALLDCAIGGYRGKGADEQTLLRRLLDTLTGGDLLLGDAYYASYFLFCALRARGVEAVFEQQGSRRRSTDFRRGTRLGARDHPIELRTPKRKPDWMAPEQFAYNLIRLMMAQAAVLSARGPRTLSFKHTLQLWMAWDQHAGHHGEDKRSALFVLIAEQRVGDRPGRIEPRAVKRRPKPFPLLTQPRAIAREKVRKHGHPRKIK